MSQICNVARYGATASSEQKRLFKSSGVTTERSFQKDSHAKGTTTQLHLFINQLWGEIFSYQPPITKFLCCKGQVWQRFNILGYLFNVKFLNITIVAGTGRIKPRKFSILYNQLVQTELKVLILCLGYWMLVLSRM